MNSIKTKSNNYSMVKSKAIGGVVFVPCEEYFRVYVAWEWEDQAKNKFFAIIRSAHLLSVANLCCEFVDHIADYGTDVTHDKEVRKLFPQLF